MASAEMTDGGAMLADTAGGVRSVAPARIAPASATDAEVQTVAMTVAGVPPPVSYAAATGG